MYRAPEKKSRSIFAIFTPIHDVMCCSCPESPITRPAGLHSTSTLDMCTINRTHRERPGGGGGDLAVSNIELTNL